MSARTLSCLTLVLLLTACHRAPSTALPPPCPASPSRVLSLALFKQGYACVVREVRVASGRAETLITDLGTPVHGTFWLLPGHDVTLLGATTVRGERTEVSRALSVTELLRANEGEVVEVLTPDGWVRGRVLRVPDDRPFDRDDTARQAPGAPAEPYPYAYRYPRPEPERRADASDLVLLAARGGQLGLPLSAVRQVRRPGGELRTEFARRVDGAALRLQTDGQGGAVRIAYVTTGFTWAPSYRLELVGENQARLIGKAVILDDSEAVDAEQTDCLVGSPNIKFQRVIDPLAQRQSIPEFLATLAGYGAAPWYDANGPMAQVMDKVAIPGPADIAAPGTPGAPGAPGGYAPPPTVDTTPGDLYLLRFGRLSLRRGERAYLPLIDAAVPCRESYRLTCGDQRYRGPGVRPAGQMRHRVRIYNPGPQPWTTAPLVIAQGDQFLAEDQLPYTPRNADTTVEVTNALDVTATVQEDVVDEAAGTQWINGARFKVTLLGGHLALHNGRGSAAHVTVEKTLAGPLVWASRTAASMDGAPATDPAFRQRQLTWEVDLKAGGEVTIDYRYRVLSR